MAKSTIMHRQDVYLFAMFINKIPVKNVLIWVRE